MFIVNLTYKTELEKFDKLLDEHIEFLNEQYALGFFLASGRKVPRTGGIILAQASSKSKIERVIEEDPFKKSGLADYEIIEFIPSKASKQLSFLIEN